MIGLRIAKVLKEGKGAYFSVQCASGRQTGGTLSLGEGEDEQE